MTRRELEVTDPKEIEKILGSCKYLHLALVDDGMPYVVTLNYGYMRDPDDGHVVLFLHGATTGKKLQIIAKNPVCSFTMECNVKPFEGRVACQYGMSYECIMGTGRITMVDDPAKKMQALECIMKTQTGRDGFNFDERMVSIVSVMRMDVAELTAKKRPLPEGLA